MTSRQEKNPLSFKDSILEDSIPGVKLPIFDGPLDLLLFLIRKNEIDIYDIPIELVANQYLQVLYAMEEVNLDLAGEFFFMAATLMQIKSSMLLPKREPAHTLNEYVEEPMDPRWQLVQQLVEYQGMKEAAKDIDSLMISKSSMIAREVVSTEIPESTLVGSTENEIWNVFNKALQRFTDRRHSMEIHLETITVADQMAFVSAQFEQEKEILFSDLILDKTPLSYLVITFFALLELSRLQKLRMHQKSCYGEITCSWVSDFNT